MTTEQINAILEQLQNLDIVAITDAVQQFITWALGIMTAVGTLIAVIQNRYNKAKLALQEANFMEKANVEKAQMIADESKEALLDMSVSFQKVTGEHQDTIDTLVTDNKVLYDTFMAMMRTGMVNSDVILELGNKLASVGTKSNLLTQEFADAMAEAEYLNQNKESLLD